MNKSALFLSLAAMLAVAVPHDAQAHDGGRSGFPWVAAGVAAVSGAILAPALGYSYYAQPPVVYAPQPRVWVPAHYERVYGGVVFVQGHWE